MDLNIRPETVKFLEENVNDLLDIDFGNAFLDLTLKAGNKTKNKLKLN